MAYPALNNNANALATRQIATRLTQVGISVQVPHAYGFSPDLRAFHDSFQG